MTELDYRIERGVVRRGFDGRTFWGQARFGVVPSDEPGRPTIVLTAQPVLRSGSDVFQALSEWRTSDLGRTWEGPVDYPEALGRRQEPDGVTVGVCDMTPRWHALTRTLLMTGHTVRYRDDRHPLVARRRETAYSFLRPGWREWTPWATVEMPRRPDFAAAGAGSGERFDLEDGTILLPIYYKAVSADPMACHAATVMRCAFDGGRLTYLEHGTELTVPEPRGLCEPSVTRFRGRFYLTLRNDVCGYVTSGPDGLHYDPPRPWRFDDGSCLGSYNTQQHWITHADGLFLVYTRRGLNNDHVFRHRAPLMMARVDPERLVVLRQTERELVPNRGARLGNFSCCAVTEEESWVVVAEWMQPEGCERYGSDNAIWFVRILWDRPNRP